MGVADYDLAYSKPNVMMYVGSNDDSNSYGKESSGDSKTGVDTSLLINSEGIYTYIDEKIIYNIFWL